MSGYTTQEFLRALYNEGEHICAGGQFETEVFPLAVLNPGAPFITVNPMKPGSRRADASTAVFRNILVEIDGLSLEEQEAYVEDELALPFTTKVFSGGKSFHYVISLAQPLSSIESYREVAQWILDVAPAADTSCRNPSRFTRLGGGEREPGIDQEILEIRDRVSPGALTEFLRTNVHRVTAAQAERERIMATQQGRLIDPDDVPPGFRGRLTLRTDKFISEGRVMDGRNNELFFAACDFANNMYTISEATERLLPAASRVGMPHYEAQATIHKAYRKAPLRPRI